MSVSSEVKRTLVKSPPELWSELSDPASLARHLGELGEVTIVHIEPERSVEWEAPLVSGKVTIEPSGWGTKVTLTATRAISPPEPHSEAEQAAESQPPSAASEPAVDLDADSTAEPLPAAHAAAEPSTDAAATPHADASSEPAAQADTASEAAPQAEAAPHAELAPHAKHDDLALAPWVERPLLHLPSEPHAAQPQGEPALEEEPALDGAPALAEEPALEEEAAPPAGDSAREAELPAEEFLQLEDLPPEPESEPEPEPRVGLFAKLFRRRRRAAAPAREAELAEPAETAEQAPDPLEPHAEVEPRDEVEPQAEAAADLHAELAGEAEGDFDAELAAVADGEEPAAALPGVELADGVEMADGATELTGEAIAADEGPADAQAPAELEDLEAELQDEAELQADAEQEDAQDIGAELRALEERDTAILAAVLDRLGAAHHRPFSRA